MTTAREKFIQESAMRNMQALLSRQGWSCEELTNERNEFAVTAIAMANAMADYLFEPDED